jgi:hypothetical protein
MGGPKKIHMAKHEAQPMRIGVYSNPQHKHVKVLKYDTRLNKPVVPTKKI